MRGLPAVYESDGSLLLLTLLLTILKLFRRSGMDGETVALICGSPARSVFCSESSRDADRGPRAPEGGGRDAGAEVEETADMGTDIACAEEDDDDGLCGGTVLLGVKLAHEGESVSDERTLGSELRWLCGWGDGRRRLPDREGDNAGRDNARSRNRRISKARDVYRLGRHGSGTGQVRHNGRRGRPPSLCRMQARR